MMNEQLNEFVKGVGALTETWTVIYKGFISQGYATSDALTHTREFMSAFLISLMNNSKKDIGDSE